MQGEETKKKITPEKVVLMMRTMRDSDGGKFFKPHEFKNEDQIKSLFSRMSQQQRAGKLKKPKEKNKDQLQCDIPTEIVEPDQSNETEEGMNVAENYFKIEVNDFAYVSLAKGSSIYDVHKSYQFFDTPLPPPPSTKMNNRIHKHVTNFKTPPAPFCVNVIHVWSLMKEIRNHFHDRCITLDKFCELTRMILN